MENESTEESTTIDCKEVQPTKIQHLVISGGGTYGLYAYGVLKETHEQNIWSVKDIRSCHATSIGTLLSVIVLLDYEWETLDKFIVKRPWSQLFQYDITQCIDSFDKCGMYDKTILQKSMEPLLKGVDLDIDVTMDEFFALTGTQLYFYAVEINSFSLEVFTHETHPKMKLLDAIYASCSLPMIFQPLFMNENKAYLDGGLFLNYPIQECLRITHAEPNEVLGIYKNLKQIHSTNILQENANFLDYSMVILRKMIKHMNQGKRCEECKMQFEINDGYMSFEEMYNIVANEEVRKNMIEKGVLLAQERLCELEEEQEDVQKDVEEEEEEENILIIKQETAPQILSSYPS